MTRYRKAETAMWHDENFCALSSPPPNAQTLWTYLLIGPRTTTFPGLVVARAEVMASDLGWQRPALVEKFGELAARMMARADWKAGVVVLTKGLLDGAGEPRGTAKPESPNVLRSWAKSWTEVPECSLKNEYLRTLGSFAEALGKGYPEAFREAFRKALGKASPQPCPNQEQEQESSGTARVPDLGVVPSSSGASDPDPDSKPRASARAPTPYQAANGYGAVPAAGDARGDERKRLIRELWAAHLAIYNRVRADIGSNTPGVGVASNFEAALAKLVDAQVSLDGFESRARHVLLVREAEAFDKNTLKFLGPSVWSPTAFDIACGMQIGERREERARGAAIGAATPRVDHPVSTKLRRFGEK